MKIEQAIYILDSMIDRAEMCQSQSNDALNIAISALMAQAEQENPKPLTMDELKERVGKPIWTVTRGLNGSGRWELLRDEHKGTLYLATINENYEACEDTYSKTWLAYDHEQEAHT